MRIRLTLTVHHIASQYVGKRVATMTHSGAINAYIAASPGLERDFSPASNTSISGMCIKGKRHLLIELNDISHLSRLDC
jgi:broad specificity phosphatase PhoE